jgi:diguanylate cyclase (GGDEF)-like protein/PAS domain S-box-containing protein
MYRVFNCLATEHDWRLVALAVLVCLVASLVALGLFQRARAMGGAMRAVWIAGAGAVTGGSIWATHFIAMLAYEPGVATAYEGGLTALSLVAAMAVTTMGLAVAVHGPRPWGAAIGGAIVGIAVAIMHYLGMAALEVPGRVTWAGDLVLASIVLGIVLAPSALVLAVKSDTARARLAAATLLALAVVAHHFTAMGAITIVLDPALAIQRFTLSDTMLAMIIAAATCVMLGVSIVGAAIDRRLARQNALLDSALNNMNHGLMMFDAASRVILCNQRYIDLYRLDGSVVRPGMTLREVVGLRIAAGTFNDDPERYCAEVLGAVSRGAKSKKITEMADGRTIAVVGEPLADGGWVATHQDITEEQRREASFRLLFESSPVAMWVWDHETLRYLAVNDAAVAQYGYSRESFLAMLVTDIRQSEGDFTVRKIIAGYSKRTLDGRSSRHIKADGTPIDVAVYGRTMTYDGRAASLVALVDVTERKRAEDELRRTQEFLNTVIDSVPVTIAVKNAHDLTYVLLNRAGESLLDIPRERIIGKTAYDVFAPDAADAITQRDKELLADGKTLTLTQHAIDTPGKGKRFINSTRVVVQEQDGEPRFLMIVIDDVTERKKAVDELRSTRAFLDAVVETMPAILAVKDAELRYVLVNRAAEQCFGLSREEMLGMRAEDVFSPDAAGFVTALDADVMRSGDLVEIGAHAVETPRHGTRMLTTKKLMLRGDDGATQYLLSLSEDVTDRTRAEQQVAHMARHDTLTDLPNRAAFNDHLGAAFKQAAASGGTFAVLCIDLDRFKEVNDVFGHSTGDALLCEVGRRMRALAEGAFLARLGGDEFTLIVTEGAQPATAEATAERLLETVASEVEIGGQHLRIGMSIGVAVFPADGKDSATLLGNADAALYRAKAEGRGSIRFFAAEMDERLRERRALQHELRSAVDHGELALHYQPQAAIGGEILGFEALVRWHHPTRGLIQPNAFIPLAEESGLIVSLGEWILREACREAATWPRPLQIAVNLSPIQFRHGDLPLLVHSVLLETGLAPHRLELEVTEGVLIGDFARAQSILRRLKSLGVRIAMDDFGTGYSSLSYLQAFPFDKIKIDRTFIANLTSNEHSAAIVRAVIGLGRGLSLPVVAEGVETGEQLAFLRQESCDEMQGYFIGRPAPIESYAELVGRETVPERKAALG